MPLILRRAWLRGRTGARPARRAKRIAEERHLAEFARTRVGVEGYLEPRTAMLEPTLVLVAGNGEWTRRVVASPSAAAAFARRHAIPLYDAERVGYPQRMREWSRRQPR